MERKPKTLRRPYPGIMRQGASMAIGVCLGCMLLLVSCARRPLREEVPTDRDWEAVIPVNPYKGIYFDRRTGRHFAHQEFIFEYASRFAEGLCAVKRRADDKKGYIDRAGRVVIPYQYDRAEWFTDGRAWVKVGEADGLIDRTGRWVVEPGRYDALYVFSEGRCAFRKGERWGFLDTQGKVVIPPIFQPVHLMALEFREGLCLVKDQSGQRVYIDRGGRVRIRSPGGVRFAYFFSEGLARVDVDVGPPDDNPLDWGRVRPRSLYGYICADGRMAIEPRFGTAGDFSQGLAPVTMTEDGTYAITRELVSLWNPHRDFPEPPPRWGFINKKGEVAIPFLYEKAGHFSEGLAPVKQNGLWGYVDRKGRMVIGAVFEYAREFRNGLAEVVVEGKSAYVDRQGRVVVRAEIGGMPW